MNNRCQKVKDHWIAYATGLLNSQDRTEIEQHLDACSRCRAFAYAQRFPELMQEAFRSNPPELSDHYFFTLRQKLAQIEREPASGFTELLAQQCWRLVPVLGLLLVFILASVSYQYAQLEPMAQPLEESVVFGDTAPTEQTILGAIINEENNDEQ